MIEINKIYNEDCLEGMKKICDKSIDMILCDLPYGTTACKWDTIIPFEPLWELYKRIIKDNGAIVLTANQPFTSKLVMSNIDMFKYTWYWKKSQGINFAQCNYMPLKIVEDIIVFGKFGLAEISKNKGIYNPQDIKICNKIKSPKTNSEHRRSNANKEHVQKYENYPNTVLEFGSERGLHPTQKPVALFEYLIKTYTNEGDLVLDNCMGSGTTAIACINIKRNYIGFELNKGYFNIAEERIKNNKIQQNMFE